MDFVEAEDTIVDFGKHQGKTLGDIADEDILYLYDLFVDIAEMKTMKDEYAKIYEPLKTYLSDDAVDAEVESNLKKRKNKKSKRNKSHGMVE